MNEIERAIRNMPDDHCRPGAPQDLTLPLCEHRAYDALCRAIESLRAKAPGAEEIPKDQFMFATSELFEEAQLLYPLEIVREIIVVLSNYLEIPVCDCGATEDPYLCGGNFVQILNTLFSAPTTH
jgi:hypothetical protein